MQVCVSRRKVQEYCAKYATKSEPRSQPLSDIYSGIVQKFSPHDNALKVIQKLLINTVGDRYFSAQETCHLLLQLPLYSASREFVILSLDNSRQLKDRVHEHSPITKPSIVDHYHGRPNTTSFNNITLLNFAQQYSMPKELGSNPKPRAKPVVIIVRPHHAPDVTGPNYEQYCMQKLTFLTELSTNYCVNTTHFKRPMLLICILATYRLHYKTTLLV